MLGGIACRPSPAQSRTHVRIRLELISRQMGTSQASTIWEGMVPRVKRGMTLVVSAAVALAVAHGAAADPTNAKTSLAIPATCDNGQSYVVSVNGNGEFTPAHVIGSSSVFIPQAFDLTFSFTPRGGPTESETDTSSKPNVHGNLTTCTIAFSQETPEGTFGLDGTVTGFFTPASG